MVREIQTDECTPSLRTPARGAYGDRELSARESSVLRLLASGISYKAIGDALGIGTETVRTHIQNICSKTGTRNRLEAVSRYLSVHPEETWEIGPDAVDFTRRERDVLALLKDGFRDKMIAERLDIRSGTVGCHLKRIYRKIGVRNRVEAMKSLAGTNEEFFPSDPFFFEPFPARPLSR